MCGVKVQAQQSKKVHRIGFLGASSPSAISGRLDAFRQGLRERGYVEGKNIVIEYRYAEGKLDRLPALAAELVRLKVDVMVLAGPASIRPSKEATDTIPIVMANDADPVGSGMIDSLARPGGNVTGNTFLGPELVAKRSPERRGPRGDLDALAEEVRGRREITLLERTDSAQLEREAALERQVEFLLPRIRHGNIRVAPVPQMGLRLDDVAEAAIRQRER